MMVGKVVGLGFEIISKLDRYSLMTVKYKVLKIISTSVSLVLLTQNSYFPRYDSPVNASPSRIADHLRPWDDDVDGITSRRSFFSATPFLPSTPGLVGGRISTTSPKGRKSSTLPSRNSPAHPGGPLTYSTDFSTDISDGEGGGKDSTGTAQFVSFLEF